MLPRHAPPDASDKSRLPNIAVTEPHPSPNEGGIRVESNTASHGIKKQRWAMLYCSKVAGGSLWKGVRLLATGFREGIAIKT